MMDILFFELIRVAIGTQESLSRVPTVQEWKKLYDMAKKQSLVGICFAALQKLALRRDENDYENENRIQSNEPGAKPAEDHALEPCEVMAKYWNMPEMLYLKWMGMAAKIQQKNELMNAKTKEALAFFREKGFPCQVLKGQGIAALYREASPQPSPEEGGSLKSLPLGGDLEEASSLALLRQSGDIDVWLAGGKEKAFELSKQVLGHVEGVTNYHIHFPIMDDAEIELHFKPSFLSSPKRNRRFLEFCKMHEPKKGCSDEPSVAFNLIYILLHCYRHLCGHGVGMRQVMDYYFVLLASDEGVPDAAASAETERLLGSLHLEVLAGAVMYVLQTVMDLPDHLLLCAPRREEGMALLSEIMQAGNFGHYDTRATTDDAGDDWRSQLHRYWRKTRRNIVIAMQYPHEGLWEPLFHLYQYWWRRGNDK